MKRGACVYKKCARARCLVAAVGRAWGCNGLQRASHSTATHKQNCSFPHRDAHDLDPQKHVAPKARHWTPGVHPPAPPAPLAQHNDHRPFVAAQHDHMTAPWSSGATGPVVGYGYWGEGGAPARQPTGLSGIPLSVALCRDFHVALAQPTLSRRSLGRLLAFSSSPLPIACTGPVPSHPDFWC